MANILGVGQSALTAAQIGLNVTGHNIANASTEGYSRQIVLQSAISGQDTGFGYVGKGTQVTAVQRVYNEVLARQLMSAQTSQSQLKTYYTQISQLDNMLADSTAGLSPALQDFFSSVQDLASDPGLAASRQSLLSSAQTLVARFQSLNDQMTEIRQGVNDQIQTSTGVINTYAKQIAQLNDAIAKAVTSGDGSQPNDLLDQRDQALAELSKEVKVSVIKQGDSYDVYIGNGQPLVVGTRSYSLTTVASETDPSRLEVAYQSASGVVRLSESSLSGGNLSGLLEFRSNTLDPAQNALGRMAIALASDFNAQHRLGLDQNGAMGGDFFTIPQPLVNASGANQGSATLAAAIVDTSALTASDYQVQVTAAAIAEDLSAVPPQAAVPAQYKVTRLSDGKVFDGSPASVDGVSLELSGTAEAGDVYLVKPTANGASSALSVAITNTSAIAAAAPIRTSSASTNTGSGKISAGSVNQGSPLSSDLQQAITITFTSATTYDVSGSGDGLPATGLTYSAGSNISYNGWTVQISGAPAAGDSFAIEPNTGASSDNRNILALAALQTKLSMDGGTTNYQGAYSQLVSTIGNKTRELEATSAAAEQLYTQAKTAQQSESGVNLDEEAANLLRYQQAYQAAAKLMQTASDLFEVLLSLGG